MNEHLVKALAFICLAAIALALIFTHQVQYLPEVAGAGLAVLVFL